MSVQQTAVRFNTSSIATINTNLINLSSGVNTLSTNIGRVFSTQQSTFTTSNLNITGGTITLSNIQTADPYRYGATFSNSGLKIVSEQLAHIYVVNPSGNTSEILFDTVAAGGPFTAIGANTAPRGAFFFVNGDAININQNNQAITLGSGSIGTAQSNFKLLVNGNSAFTSSMTLSNGDFSMSNTRTQNADFISTGINIYNGNFLLSTTTALAGSATFNKTNLFLNAGNFTQSNTAAIPGTANLFNTALTVTGAQTIFNSTVTINGGALLLSNVLNVGGTTTSATFYSTNMNIYNGNFLQSNVNSVTSYATFYSTAMTVHGSISTTGTLLCLGRFNTPNVGNVSTLIVGNNIASTAKVSLDVNGSLRTSVQKFVNVSGAINVNGGNLVYGSNASGTITLTIPETDGAEVGIYFNIHTDIGGGGAAINLSTSGGDYINTAGTHTYTISKTTAITTLFCYETGSWHAVTTG